MLEYTFNFWQMLGLLFVSYHLGALIADVKREMIRRNSVSKEVKIDITKVGDVLYAFEEESKKFLAQSNTYEDLRKSLTVLSPNITYIIDTEKLKALLGENHADIIRVP